jgi:hypothetical protein
MRFIVKLRNLLSATCALVIAIAVSLPGAASAADIKQPVDPALKKAFDNATLYVPSMVGVVHFHNGSAKKKVTVTGLGPHPRVLDGTAYSYIDDIFTNTSKPHVWHAPDAVAVVTSSGTLSGNSVFTDVIAVRYVHGKLVRAAHHQVFGHVQKVEFVGRSVTITYLTVGPNDPRCCGTLVKQMTLQYTGAPELKEVPTP